ncbi:MAG: hypothetical protein KAQ97_02790 [Candidatus Fermentibacteraceae bacterium]|nr:hypothetical protein [Candidatus Fermentibacteraceae bacterium]
MKSLLVITILVSVSFGELAEDLRSIGVPVLSAELQDSMVIISISGTLTQGDSLLKHYGGVFYTVTDSIIGGWDICGIIVEIEEATLVFRRNDMLLMFEQLSEIDDDEVLADWVLNHTRVFRDFD